MACRWWKWQAVALRKRYGTGAAEVCCNGVETILEERRRREVRLGGGESDDNTATRQTTR